MDCLSGGRLHRAQWNSPRGAGGSRWLAESEQKMIRGDEGTRDEELGGGSPVIQLGLDSEFVRGGCWKGLFGADAEEDRRGVGGEVLSGSV